MGKSNRGIVGTSLFHGIILVIVIFFGFMVKSQDVSLTLPRPVLLLSSAGLPKNRGIYCMVEVTVEGISSL